MKLHHKGAEINYLDEGSGSCILLLHGFLEDVSMWDHLTKELIKNHRVVRVDLLGHGRTGNQSYIHTMKDMAQAVECVLKFLEIDSFIVIGHSMGGYVALELAALNKTAIEGVCLLNSTYRSDSKERKLLRRRAIRMAKANYGPVVRMSFTNLFSEESRIKFNQEIEDGLMIALSTSQQGYLAAQEGMIKRKDHFELYKSLKCKKLIILGKKDGLLNADLMIKELLDVNVEMVLLSEGHMLHIENKEEFTYNIMHFIEK